MRHRYRVDLYDDVEIEARLVDLIESMPRSRRQEFLRTMIKIGFLNSYGASEGVSNAEKELPKLAPSSSRPPRGGLAGKADKKTSEGLSRASRTNASEEKSNPIADERLSDNPNVSKGDDKKHLTESNKENNSSNEEENNIPSINTKSDEGLIDNETSSDSDDNDDDVVDSLDEFKGLFDGLNNN